MIKVKDKSGHSVYVDENAIQIMYPWYSESCDFRYTILKLKNGKKFVVQNSLGDLRKRIQREKLIGSVVRLVEQGQEDLSSSFVEACRRKFKQIERVCENLEIDND